MSSSPDNTAPKLHPVADATQSEQAAAAQAQQAQSLASPEKKHNTGIYRFFPDWLIDHAPQITNAGLFTGTAIMLHSGYRGKVISEDIWKTQMDTIMKTPGMTPERGVKIAELAVKDGLIPKPGWHKMRLIYLLTAMVSFAIGAIFPRKDDTPEEKEKMSTMGIVDYMRTRTQQAFDPVAHSRQTVGAISGISGLMAIMSALSQPGGISKSELYVGTTLATGGALLTYINNSQLAQNLFSALWMARLPAIYTGAFEFTTSTPKFKNPLLAEMKQQPEYFAALQDAAKNGTIRNDYLGLKKTKVFGDEAIRVKAAGYGGMELPYKRKDYAYPTGQITNMFAAAIGFLGKGASKAKEAKAQQQAPSAPTEKPVESTQNIVKTPAAQKMEALQDQPSPIDTQVNPQSLPSAQVQAPPSEITRLEAANDKEMAAKHAAVA